MSIKQSSDPGKQAVKDNGSWEGKQTQLCYNCPNILPGRVSRTQHRRAEPQKILAVSLAEEMTLTIKRHQGDENVRQTTREEMHKGPAPESYKALLGGLHLSADQGVCEKTTWGQGRNCKKKIRGTDPQYSHKASQYRKALEHQV